MTQSPSTLPKTRHISAIVVRNSAFVLGAQVAIKVLSLLFSVYVVRRLGSEDYGEYSTVLAYITLFAIFSDLGMAPYTVREVAKNWAQARLLFPNIVSIRLILSLAVVVVATLLAPRFHYVSDMVIGIFIAGCGLFLYSVQGPLDSLLIARERVDLSATFSFVNQFIFVALGTVALVTGLGFIGLLGASMVGLSTVTILSIYIVFRRIGLERRRPDVHAWKGLVCASLPFGLAGLASSLTDRFDFVFLSVMRDSTAVGFYAVSYNLMVMLLIIPQSLAISLYPTLVHEYKRDPSAIRGPVQRAVKYLLMVSLPITVGATVLGKQIITMLYTADFAPSGPVLQILIWSLPSIFLAEIFGRTTSVLHKERAGARIALVNATVNVTLNVLLVPRFGITGSAIANTITTAVLLVQQVHLLGLNLIVKGQGRCLLRVAIASGLMGIVVWLVREWQVLLVIGLGIVVYAALILALRIVDRQELTTLRDMIFRRQRVTGEVTT